MARLPRLCLPGIPQQVIQRGNKRQVCFASNEDLDIWGQRVIGDRPRFIAHLRSDKNSLVLNDA